MLTNRFNSFAKLIMEYMSGKLIINETCSVNYRSRYDTLQLSDLLTPARKRALRSSDVRLFVHLFVYLSPLPHSGSHQGCHIFFFLRVKLLP